MFQYLVKEDEFVPALEIGEEGLKALNSDLRREIIRQAAEKKMTVDDLASKLDRNPQTVYYNVQMLESAGILNSNDGKPKYFSTENSAYYFRPEFVEAEENPVILGEVPPILEGFVENRTVKGGIIVGAPYQHGKYGRRHKSGFEAAEIACFLGNHGRRRGNIVYKDTELDASTRGRPLITLGGPLVNTFTDEINPEMPVRFDESHNRIISETSSYSGDDIGFVCRGEIEGNLRIAVAGLYGVGTSAAVEALSSRAHEIGEKGAVVRGFGTKHDIEEIEVLEKI